MRKNKGYEWVGREERGLLISWRWGSKLGGGGGTSSYSVCFPFQERFRDSSIPIASYHLLTCTLSDNVANCNSILVIISEDCICVYWWSHHQVPLGLTQVTILAMDLIHHISLLLRNLGFICTRDIFSVLWDFKTKEFNINFVPWKLSTCSNEPPWHQWKQLSGFVFRPVLWHTFITYKFAII